MILEVILIHLTNIAEDGLPFRLAWLAHHQGDAVTVGPVTALTEKKLAQFRNRDAVHR